MLISVYFKKTSANGWKFYVFLDSVYFRVVDLYFRKTTSIFKIKMAGVVFRKNKAATTTVFKIF